MSKTKIIFCDFDGTITEKDNIIDIMKNFAPNGWELIKDQILNQEISIREGVEKLFSLIPSDRKNEIVSYVLSTAKIREGFNEFAAYTKEHNIPLFIVSGGIDFFVYPMLDGIINQNKIYCNGSNFQGETIQILWPHSCDSSCSNDCGCCKPTILRGYDSSRYEKIVIGDSITDLQAAKIADKVFARDFLIEKCEELSIAYDPFSTFYEIVQYLEEKGVRV
ncbi:2-hydroxy-3-keto-5-methylthiopentenyl-1-phosphate phosphatase [Fictibacillus sp. KIGAM418]|uniref:2-hydroxy-3-keto-5-methylthiopentenyl-1-phosphate phosphatase n=1 Tax=Fictibacillus marinisediminis TaxID=2878389 RepID=A0A9X1XC43_9BACL|nr:2-hydroxy-3-keto-5-methylthiopentenyl-1-phosphate phosphatase [Fictibacillus marinisediminis]MCK6256688.1 2-hydroxy-3-keto-5-methylthiopentenyl-1-phosphate phosphatase [Fictibacillus marinisediminis]